MVLNVQKKKVLQLNEDKIRISHNLSSTAFIPLAERANAYYKRVPRNRSSLFSNTEIRLSGQCSDFTGFSSSENSSVPAYTVIETSAIRHEKLWADLILSNLFFLLSAA